MNGNINKLKSSSNKNYAIIETKKIKLLYDFDNGCVIYAVRYLSVKAGFNNTDEIMIATAASELATNILRYAGEGELDITILKNIDTGAIGIELFASDNGPGIEDVELALKDHYSSQPNSLGLGLPSVKRIMDEFYIESILGKETRVLSRKWRKDGKC